MYGHIDARCAGTRAVNNSALDMSGAKGDRSSTICHIVSTGFQRLAIAANQMLDLIHSPQYC
jgi:hypothetical protein